MTLFIRLLKLISLAGPLLMASGAFAQQESSLAPPPEAAEQQMSADSAMPMEQQTNMAAMNKMAETVTRMAEMCEKMMQMEMKGMSLKMAGLTALFILLIVDLALLAVLQTQLIKHWHRRLKSGAWGAVDDLASIIRNYLLYLLPTRHGEPKAKSRSPR